MCDDATKKAKNIADQIKRMLMNYDMSILYADGELKLCTSTMNLYANKTSKYAQKKFLNAKIDAERFSVFIEDLEKNRQEILDNLSLILDRYQPRYKQIFMLYFFENASYETIAEKTNYSLVAINKIIKKLKDDLFDFFIP